MTITAPAIRGNVDVHVTIISARPELGHRAQTADYAIASRHSTQKRVECLHNG